MPVETKTFLNQALLANYCRTGEETNIPGARADRVKHYRRLIFHVVEDSLRTAYPLTCQLLDEKEWLSLVQDFFSNHNCCSPQIWRMPYDLYEYVKNTNYKLLEKYPILIELLFFEWIEIEMFMGEDKQVKYTLNGNPESSCLVVNPELNLYQFTYPVHLKSAKTIHLSDRGNYFLSVHRHPESKKVLFTNLSPALVLLLELLREKSMKLSELVLEVTGNLNIPFSHEILCQVSFFIHKAIESRLIIGFKKYKYYNN